MSDSFWFQSTDSHVIGRVRIALALVTGCYFVSAMTDVSTWFAVGAPASSSNLAGFFREAGLESDARWMISPLFLWDAIFAGTALSESTAVYQIYLVIGVLIAFGVAALSTERVLIWRIPRLLRGGLPVVLLWIWFVGWANRIVLLAGLVEPVLSLSLAALAIAPVCREGVSWRNHFATRLIAVQGSLVLIATTALMLAGNVWWNGTGAYAMIAPVEDRWLDVRQSFFETTWVYELVSAITLLSLPVGLMMAWTSKWKRIGIGLILVWCFLVALLSMKILYALTIAIIAFTLGTGNISRRYFQSHESRSHQE